MTYRSLDLQPVTRTPEIAQLQHQQQYRFAQEQTMLAQQTVRQAREQAQKTIRKDEAAGVAIRDRAPDKRRPGGERNDKRDGRQAPPAKEPNLHPYKGKHIDLTL